MKIYLAVRIDCPTPQRPQEIANEVEQAIDAWVDEQEESRVDYATVSIERVEFND